MTGTKQAAFKSFNWLRAVSNDRAIPILRRFILLKLCFYRNEKTGRCDPSHDRIAAEIGVHRVTVVKAIADGVRRGWLVQPIRRGPTSNSFAFTFPVSCDAEKDVAPEQHQAANDVAPEHERCSPPATSRCSPRATQTESKNGQRERGKSQTRAPDLFPGRKEEAAEEGSKQEKRPAGARGDVAEAFGRFWAVFPKRVGKLDAEKAWKAATKLADVEAIIAGAKRYAIERANEPARYTKNPATWLRAGCWADEPVSGSGPPMLDNDGNIIEPPPRHNGHRRDDEMSSAELAASIFAELEARDGH